MDCSLPGSSLHGILQARALEWVAISFSRGSSRPRDCTLVSCIPGRHFNLCCVAQLCPTLCYPMDTRLLRPWDFLGKSTGVGCRFLLHILIMEIYYLNGTYVTKLKTLSFYKQYLNLSRYVITTIKMYMG